jgi:hypothetical protein
MIDVENLPDREPDSPEEKARKEQAQLEEAKKSDPIKDRKMPKFTVEDCKKFGIVGEHDDKHWVVSPYKVDAENRVLVCYYHEWGERETGEVDDDKKPIIGVGLFAEMVRHGEPRYRELLDALEVL